MKKMSFINRIAVFSGHKLSDAKMNALDQQEYMEKYGLNTTEVEARKKNSDGTYSVETRELLDMEPNEKFIPNDTVGTYSVITYDQNGWISSSLEFKKNLFGTGTMIMKTYSPGKFRFDSKEIDRNISTKYFLNSLSNE